MTVPVGFQTRYFHTTSASDYPVIVREGNMLIIPCFIEVEAREDGGENYTFYAVPVPFRGQDYSDYDKCVLKSWSDLRAFFYGSQAAQSEMRDDHVWEAHRQAVRSYFPKYAGEVNLAVARFNAIKESFWEIVDAALAEMGESRSALPAYFTAEDMIEFATGKLTATKITKYQMQFMIVSHNLEMNDRNWLELFDV
jgi:hypothetical protein